MIFTDANEAGSPSVDDAVCVAESSRRSDRLGHAPRTLCIHPAVAEVGEVDNSIGNRERSPAVLMNTGANVEALWCDLLDAPVIFDQQDDSASALLRAVLQDVELVDATASEMLIGEFHVPYSRTTGWPRSGSATRSAPISAM